MGNGDIWAKIMAVSLPVLALAGAGTYLVMAPNDKTLFLVAYLFLFVMFAALCVRERHCDRKGKATAGNEIVHIFDRYGFLLRQLIGRDFAVKYRRSYLGLLWTIISPLMTMVVMSAIFSFIFKNNIEHYPVYLILGNTIYGFFSEATNAATGSVLQNGQLIKKVYMPKYIFPLSRVCFSFYNFLLSLIPIALVLLVFRIPPSRYLVMLPLTLLGLFLFGLGVGFFLSAMFVFMRDVQYLYTIVLQLWFYATPIFYPVDALSPPVLRLMYFNPLFLYIDSFRRILLYHNAPSARQMIGGLVIGILSFVVGLHVFYRRQDRFILYI